MPWWRWSQTANNNASGDPTINFAEGQSPSSLNDSCRAMMSASAMYRDDIAGAIVTGGTSTAYTVTSYSVYDTLAHLNGQMIAFSPHITNGATVTLNVDGLGAKPLRTSPNVELLAGMIIQGTPYVATYNNGDGAFYLQGFYGNPYNIPLGAMLDFTGTTTPNSSFAFPTGQAISRTTYATYFAQVGTTYGAGDGSTTFNVIDMTGRIGAMKEASATRLTSTYFGGNSTVLGATGGLESETLTLSQLPNGINSSGSNSITVTSNRSDILPVVGAHLGGSFTQTGGFGFGWLSNPGSDVVAVTSTNGSQAISVTSNNTSGSAHPIVQPTIIVNKILRII